MAIERHIGGGRLYFEKLENGTYQTKVEIGEVKEVTISSSVEKVEALNYDVGFGESVDEVTKKQDYGIKFTTQNVSRDNLTLAFYGSTGTKTYAVGDELPDGTTATEETTLNTLEIGTEDKVEGRVTFVSAPVRGKKRVYVCHKVSMQFNGDFALMSEEFVNIPFEGKILKDITKTEGSQYISVSEWQ